VESLAREGYSKSQESLEMRDFELEGGADLEADDPELVAKIVSEIELFAPTSVILRDTPVGREVVAAFAEDHAPFFVLYGYGGDPLGYDNVVGVLEVPHVEETLYLARRLVPDATTFTLVGMRSPSGIRMTALTQEEIVRGRGEVENTVFLARTWEVWQEYVLTEAEKVDFLLLMRYDGLINAQGDVVPSPEVMEWTARNSPVPVFGLWQESVQDGAVGGLTLSNYEQGAAAGSVVVRVARGTPLREILVVSPEHNLLTLNLAAASHWGLEAPVELVLAAHIYRRFPEN
jgi:ABC-type uncharacterized transport system substrate-binding protein